MTIPLTVLGSLQINYSYVGLVLCMISFTLVWRYARKKRVEECIVGLGLGMVGLLLFFSEKVTEIISKIGGPIIP